MKSGIIWLASYPKSGNTWLRIFLTNLRCDGEEPVNINELDGGPIASARALFDEATASNPRTSPPRRLTCCAPKFTGA